MEHTDAALAATSANTVAEILIEYSYRNKNYKLFRYSGWLNARIASCRQVQQAVSEFGHIYWREQYFLD
jgi:hypothetical protein